VGHCVGRSLTPMTQVDPSKLDLVLFYDVDNDKLRQLETETDWPSKHQ
jgi:hypothetical protein